MRFGTGRWDRLRREVGGTLIVDGFLAGALEASSFFIIIILFLFLPLLLLLIQLIDSS